MYAFDKIFMRQGILLGCFNATVFRVQRDFPHTTVTSLVKYPPGGHQSKANLDEKFFYGKITHF